MIESEAKQVKPLIRKTARALRRMGYKWKPEPGQWACWRRVQGGISEPELITHYNGRHVFLHNMGPLPQRGLVPVLHWEAIQKIMLSLGYKLYFRNPIEGATVAFAKLKEIEHSHDIIEMLNIEEHIPSDKWYHASSFQPAVMQAVVELEEKEKKR